MSKTSRQLTREEFGRLLDAYANAHGQAWLAADYGAEDYADAVAKSVAARNALENAVFPCPCGAFPDSDGHILHSALCPEAK